VAWVTLPLNLFFPTHFVLFPSALNLVRDPSAVRRLFVRLAGAVGRQSALHKENSGFVAGTLVSAHFHVLWLSDFIFYPKPLYKSLHQTFFYSFIPSESGVTLHYSMILP
jgi:hypothetical protein